jgi:hypothetical protein
MKRNRYATQGACIAHALMKRPMSYAQMLALGAGLSPWRRCAEWLRLHGDHHSLVKTTNREGLVCWRIVKATRWTS